MIMTMMKIDRRQQVVCNRLLVDRWREVLARGTDGLSAGEALEAREAAEATLASLTTGCAIFKLAVGFGVV